jgi:carboxy-cis,cis-muconate cyclase
MVDVFEITTNKLVWVQGVSILPKGSQDMLFFFFFLCVVSLPSLLTARLLADISAKLFWADEVRISPSKEYMFASTRGLEPSTKGYVSAFRLEPSGLLAEPLEPLDLWQTPTSGGWANAIEPAPFRGPKGEDLLALTDSEKGFVSVLSWDGKRFDEVSRAELPDGAGAATVQWL